MGLAMRFVKGDSGGDGDIETLRAALHGDRGLEVAGAPDKAANAGALRAQHQADPPGEVEAVERQAGRGVQGHEPVSRRLEPLQGAGEIDDAGQGHAFQRAGRGLGERGAFRRRADGRRDDGARAEGFRRTQRGADIARVADPVQKAGSYLRYESGLPGKLRELAILTVARHWGASYEWNAHAPIAESEGLDAAVIEAIRAASPPPFSDSAEAAVHAFCVEVLDTRRACDATYRAALDLLDEEGLVDLVGLMGYYCLISFTLNVFEIEPPGGPVSFA